MARTVRDVTLLFITLSGQDARDPVSPPIELRNESLEDLKRVPIAFFEEDGPVTAETREAVRDAARTLEGQGFKVRPFKPHALEEARQLWWKFFVRGGAMLLDPLVKARHAELSPTFLDFLSIAHRANCWQRWRAFPFFFARSARSPRFAMGNVVGRWMGVGSSTWMLCAIRSGLTCWAHRRRWCRWGDLPKVYRSGYRLQDALSKMNGFWVLPRR
jgi:hypothetical protein